MPSDKTVQQVTGALATVNPILAAAAPLIFKLVDYLGSRGDPDADLTEAEKRQIRVEAQASLAEFERLVTESRHYFDKWLATHPPEADR